MRGGLNPSSGRNCEFVNSVGKGNFTFVRKNVREKSGNFRNLCTCMAEVLIVPLEERISKFGSHYEQSKDLITAPEY